MVDDYPRLADLLAPTLAHGPGMVCDTLGRIAVVPLTEPTPAALMDACLLHMLLGRGVLVLA